MTGINSINPFYPLTLGVLDGSNADHASTRAAKSQLVSELPPVIQPPRKPDPEQMRWVMIDSAIIILSKEGTYQTGDGKVRIEFYSSALKDPRIDHKNLAIATAADKGKTPAIAFFGEVSPEGRFFVDTMPRGENGSVLIVVSDPLRYRILPLGTVLSHEIKHALDDLSGQTMKQYEELARVISASQGPKEEKEFFEKRGYMLMGETRARLFQIDWVASHMGSVLPEDRELMIQLLDVSVSDVNAHFGYRNYLLERNRDGVNDLKLEGAAGLFCHILDSVLERAFSEFNIADINRRLEPFKMKVDVNHKNSKEENDELTKKLAPRME